MSENYDHLAGEPMDPKDHPSNNLPKDPPASVPGPMDYMSGAAKVYGQLVSDFVAQAKGKKLQGGEYK